VSVIYMIRHGQASFGQRNYDVLSPTGILQARVLAGYLVQTGTVFDALYIFTSGGAISAAISMAVAVPPRDTARLAALVTNTAITTFLYHQERLSLASFNVASHLMLHTGGNLITYR